MLKHIKDIKITHQTQQKELLLLLLSKKG